MKTISAGIIIINSKNQILGCKPFGKCDGRHDIPKGGIEVGETPLQAAIRETFEETNLDLTGVDIEEIGLMAYQKGKKDLHLFKCNYDIDDLSNLKCTSYFKLNDCEFPEMDGYEWIDIKKDVIERRFYFSLVPLLLNILFNKKQTK